MAFGKSKPKLPMYQEMQDTPWISRNRELNTTTYNNLNRDLNNVNVFDDAIKQQLNSVVDDWYNRSLSDFDRSYNQSMAKTLARDYNRFGTTGATTSLLTRDNDNLVAQRKLADLASNRSDRYDQLINNELARRYNWLNTNYNMFTNSGNTTENHDIANWKIRNQNLDRQYSNEVQDYNNSFGHQLGKIGTAIGTGIGTFINPALGMAIYGTGNTLFSDANNMLGVNNGAIDLAPGYDNIFNIASYLGAKTGMPAWSQYGRLIGDEISSNPILNYLSGRWDLNGIPRDTRGGNDYIRSNS